VPKTTSALEKGFAVLEVLRDSQVPLTLTAIAELTGVVPSSAHATLNHLHKLDAVQLTEHKRYTLGPAVHYLGASYARATPLYRSVWIELVNVANELGVTAAIAVEWKRRHLILNAHRGPGSDVAVPFGGSIPLTAASWGKIYFAWSGADLPDTLTAHTANSITDLAQFKEAVDAVRERGYATDLEEYYIGVQGVSAAVTSGLGYEGLAAFLGAKTTMERLGIDLVGERLARIADRASNSLGDADRMRLFGSE
jgi:DNA-binding IclR family transcriptional regulator